MLIADAQRESRTVYVGGFVGQLVSSIVWLASAVVAEFVDPVTGFWTLAVGGAAIFPLTQALLRLRGCEKIGRACGVNSRTIDHPG